MEKTVVKRSPYKVGDIIKQGTMNDVIKGRKVPSCAGYKVISVIKQTHSSGAYLIELKGMRRFQGEVVAASFMVTFPLLGKKTRRAYHTAFRYFIGNNKVVKQVNIPRSTTLKSDDIKQVSKTVPAGNRKMLLMDFLEE